MPIDISGAILGLFSVDRAPRIGNQPALLVGSHRLQPRRQRFRHGPRRAALPSRCRSHRTSCHPLHCSRRDPQQPQCARIWSMAHCVNLLDMHPQWQASSKSDGVFEGRDRATGEIKWTGTRVDLVFGSNSQLRAVAEVYASDLYGQCLPDPRSWGSQSLKTTHHHSAQRRRGAARDFWENLATNLRSPPDGAS
jgi:hypothetical protein